LIALGLREFRQVFFKPYRIICRVMGNNVYASQWFQNARVLRVRLATEAISALLSSLIRGFQAGS
jgi:toxin ParE1/3/4